MKKTILDIYQNSGCSPTQMEVVAKMNCSSKTLHRILRIKGVSYSQLLSELKIESKGVSKFQSKVTSIIFQLMPDREVVSEKTFDDLRNTTTNAKLRFDIYIPSLKLAIECDGIHHNEKEHYFNVLSSLKGGTSCIVTDQIKEIYCLKNGIKFIRIPYKPNITKKYILSFVGPYL